MSRQDDLKRLDRKSRNQLRHILTAGGDDAISKLTRLRSRLGKQQSAALEAVLTSPALWSGSQTSSPFPRHPQFADRLQPSEHKSLEHALAAIDRESAVYSARLAQLLKLFREIDNAMAQARFDESLALISDAITRHGWSHALLRRLVAVRQNLPDTNDEAEALLHRAGLQANLVSVTSLVHAFSPEHSLLTIKRSILNIVDRGPVNKFSRTIARIPVQPFAANERELTSLLVEARKCSLIDAVVLAWFNSHLTSPYLPRNISKLMGEFSNSAHFERLLQIYPTSDPESEYLFYKQSSAWLEYEPIRRYRVLVDNYYDASSNSCLQLVGEHADIVRSWVGEPSLRRLVAGQQFTLHGLPALAGLEVAGTVSRSAIFNYWLQSTEGQVGFDLNDLLKLMGLTRELSRTVPVDATRTAARLSVDPLARLILLLLLAKRSNNELDSFHLRKLLEDTAIKKHGGSLVRLLEAFHIEHPYVSEYIYEIATEDFLAKLNRIAPHLSDIPEIRASLHEWMARVSGDKHFEDRARAVRIDHQLNRIRNEIDDHRIYVDPSRFSSWIQDEMMLELNSSLAATGTGRRQVPVMGDEVVLSQVMRQCYSAFCSNAMFGIASYIGRRIRHGTFHGHLYSGVIHHVEKSEPFQVLSKDPQFSSNWETWKARLDSRVSVIIKEKLHVNSKAKPQGLLQPDYYTPHKQEIIDAAVGTIISTYSELKSTEGIELVITDYCWRLAEVDLLGMALVHY